MNVWCPQRPEEDVESLGTGFADVYESLCGCWEPGSSGRAAGVLHHGFVSPVPGVSFRSKDGRYYCAFTTLVGSFVFLRPNASLVSHGVPGGYPCAAEHFGLILHGVLMFPRFLCGL